MTYSPKAIANFFLELAKSKGELLSPMKLQKLVYYAQGWYAGYTGRPLINEPIEAWQYGPVIPSLYHEFKRFGSGAIRTKATDIDTDRFELVEVAPPEDSAVQQFLTNVWNSYGRYTAVKLSEMTHAAGSPWERTWSVNGGVRGVDIPFELIRDHFRAATKRTVQATS